MMETLLRLTRERWSKGRRAIRMLLPALAVMLWLWAASSAPVSAHSVLEQASPAPGSTISESPPEIRLTFNERLERELYSIYIYDDKGERVGAPAAVMSQDQRTISVQLPKLPEGLYTVSYHIISADGHPVAESYVLTIGKPTGRTEAVQLGHKHLETVYGFRMIHYFFFLMLVGWVWWRPHVPFASAEAREQYHKWFRYFRHLNVMFVIETLALQTIDAVGDITWANISDLWFRTAVGWSYIALSAVALLAYVWLGRSRVLDLAWIIAALTAKTLSGHPMAAVPLWKAAVPDLLHLSAAALWAGGLGIVALLSRREPETIKALLPRLSAVALYSLALLVLTGFVLTLVYVPRLEDVLFTGWGILLLVKIVLAAAVVMTGARLRRLMRDRYKNSADANGAEIAVTHADPDRRLGFWLQTDIVLMLAIIGIVGMFTYLSPTPANVALNWKVDDPGIRRIVSITPNAPGVDNQFNVTVVGDTGKPAVKLVSLKLVPVGRPEVAPLQVALHPVDADPKGLRAGQKLAVFTAEGPFLPFPGKWRVELTVRDANDDEKVWRQDMRIFARTD